MLKLFNKISHVFVMFTRVIRIHKRVIKINNNVDIDILSQHIIFKFLARCRSFIYSGWHNFMLIYGIPGSRISFWLITGLKIHLVIIFPEVETSEFLWIQRLLQRVVNSGKRIKILFCDCIKASVIYAEASISLRFLNR